MWVLKHKTTGEKRYLLAEKQKYSVGRNQVDIGLMNDNTISRVHAFIHVSADSVKIVDPGSKFGVYLNANDITLNKRMDLNEPVAMQVGDIVRFGRMENVWRLEKINIDCCTSTLQADQLPKLLELLNIVNGNFHQVWNKDCTHLVMPSVTVTIKVLQSLVHGVPIVTPAFWTAYVKCVRKNCQQLPDVKDFVPVINEQFVRKNPAVLHVDLRRQRLFQGKKFMFMTRRQMASYESIIKLALGECDFLQGNTNTFVKKDLLKKEVVTILNKLEATEIVQNISTYLEKKDRRAVPDSELSLAILHCSTDRFCNPDFKIQSIFDVNTVDLTEQDGIVLVEETPQAPNQTPAPEIFVPETINLTDEDAVSNRNIGSSAVNSECVNGGESEMSELIRQFAQPTTPGQNLADLTERNGRILVPQAPAEQLNQIPAAENSVPETSNLTAEDAVSNRNIDSSAVYSACVSGGESEMSEPIRQLAQPTTSGINLGKRCRRRLSSDDAPDIEPSVQKKSKKNDFDPKESGCTSTTESSQASTLSGFSTTQKRFRKSNVAALAPPTQEPTQQPTPAERRKRALDALQWMSDDEDNNKDTEDNPFTFASKRRPKRAKLNSATNDDEEAECVFNFSSQQTQRNRHGLSQQESSASVAIDSSADEPNVLMPFNRSVTTVGMTHIKPVETSTDGWLSRAFKSDVLIGQKAAKPAALPAGVRIKEEKLEEWEMTDAEKKQKWLKSLENAIKVETFNVTFTPRIVADETDGNLSGLNASIRNFKKFVKKRNYIAQTTVVRTIPVNITVNPFARI